MRKVLVIGGGRQIGKALIDNLYASEYEITVLNRGITSQICSEYFQKKKISYIKTDRIKFIKNNDLKFDVVIDTCSYDPKQYSQERIDWRKFKGKYIFISSAYVYQFNSEYIYETSKLISKKISNKNTGSIINEYALNKIECEKIAINTISNLLVIRPGVLLSEFDHTNRIEKWIARANKGFLPRNYQKKWMTQLLSTKDLTDFIFKCINKDINGILNIAGSELELEKFWKMILTCKKTISSDEHETNSSILEFFEKKSRAIINTDKAEKIGLNKTNSEKLLNKILNSDAKNFN